MIDDLIDRTQFETTDRSLQLLILDRDDTLIRLPHGRRYLYGDAKIEFAPGAPEFIARLNQAGTKVVVATNQQGVALPDWPEMTIKAVHVFHERIQSLLRERGAIIDRFYVCPHAADEGCDCRKPKPGMIIQAMNDFEVTASNTLLIGDRMTDVDAATAAGVRGVLINSSAGKSAIDDSIGATVECFEDCIHMVGGLASEQ